MVPGEGRRRQGKRGTGRQFPAERAEAEPRVDMQIDHGLGFVELGHAEWEAFIAGAKDGEFDFFNS